MSDVERPERYDTSDTDRREDGLAAAALAVRRGELVLLPTDTVYGVGCDAFDPTAVKRLLSAKGRGREMPPPVLVSTLTTLDALADDVPEWARLLTDEFWPGPLTLVLRQQSSLQWDLGDARGTVALRMPEHDIALDLIQRTGPLAVSSANVTGMPAALDADDAIGMLGDEVVAVLDAGKAPGGVASTIVDCTGHTPRVLREGAVSRERLRAVLAKEGHWLEEDDDEPPALPAPDEAEVVEADLVPDDVVEDEHGTVESGSEPVDVVEADVVEDSAPELAPARKRTTKTAAAKKTPTKKTPTKKAPTKKAPAKKANKKASATKRTTAKTSTAARTTTKKAATKTPAAKKTTAKRTTAKKTTAKQAPADPPAAGTTGPATDGGSQAGA